MLLGSLPNKQGVLLFILGRSIRVFQLRKLVLFYGARRYGSPVVPKPPSGSGSTRPTAAM
ncbi:hypothetical protein RB4204 [Rhodopirellula baltica SH 1]|uniref:Uncharacterized protein n=1 Tax=Rhodopirellula baltica (strain DSM 10527 / NCIMB 13988 / SH1) TaxID=243090 RepID=Q7UT02_RHOBA|nr:hypothetical protein RB4204 [Rhodopirellula baltica SH 1]